MKVRPPIIIDTREQTPWTFDNLPAERGTLATGDYSVSGLESLIAVERKSLPDLLACVGRERDRFVAELQRLRAFPFRAVVVETTLERLERGDWPALKIQPAHVLGSIASWQARYAPFVFAGTPAAAARWAERFMFQSCRAIFEQYGAAAAFVEAAEPVGCESA